MRPTRRPAVLAAATVTATAVLGLAAPAVAAAAPSPDVVVAEVYGGGGNAGATLTNDFVELANRGGAAVDLGGASVQYLSAGAAGAWQVTPLAGSVAPGGRYLVAQGAGTGGTQPLPAPDATGSIPMSGTAGTVAVVDGTAPLTCRTAADCAADPRVRDLVGYGTAAVVREGTPTPNLSSTTSAARGDALGDTDDNAADLAVGAPTPAGSGGGGPTPPPPPPVGGPARIHDVQGTTRTSPLAGQVVAVPGVVTAVRAFGSARGFWLQDPQADADPATSEGVFAFTGGTTPAVAVGDAVTVTGTVAEFRPGGTGSANQSVTQLTGVTAVVASSGNALPAAEPVGVPDAYAPENGGGSIEALPLQPDAFALDWFESREGMRLAVADARVVGATDDFNGLFVQSDPAQNPTPRGGTLYASYADPNSGRVKIESLVPAAQQPFPRADVGDVLTGVTEGPLDYSTFGGYVLQATALGALQSGGLVREVTPPAAPGQLTIGTYNVENLDPTDPQDKFDRLASGVVTNMGAPAIVGLEEVQDNDGARNDGVVASDVTLGRFVDAITAAGGPRYEFRVIDPVDGEDGGQPGGNIRVGFLFDPARVSFVDRPGGDATTAVQAVPAGGGVALSVSPGRVDPQNPVWDSSRKPLAGEFLFEGRTVFVIANHFASKGGDQPLHGRFQPPNRSSEIQRTGQATVLRGFVDDLLRVEPQADVVVLGDLNDFPFSPTLDILTRQGGLRSLIDTLPADERYSYVFDGNSQTLDHVLVTRSSGRVDYDVVHINAEFDDQASDHDPQVVALTPRGPRR